MNTSWCIESWKKVWSCFELTFLFAWKRFLKVHLSIELESFFLQYVVFHEINVAIESGCANCTHIKYCNNIKFLRPCLKHFDRHKVLNYVPFLTYTLRGWLRPKLVMEYRLWEPRIWAPKLIKVIKKDSKTNTNSFFFIFNAL